MRDNIANMKFGQKIKEARTAAGLTQEQLGIKCGWTTGNPQSRIGNYEKDVRNPSAADIAIIASALNKGILFFYNKEDAQSIAEPPASYATEPQHLSTAQIEMLEKVITTVERKFEEIDARTKAKLVAEMFSNYTKLGLTAKDLADDQQTPTQQTN
mgnify:CR=1 FL=1